MTPPMTDEQLLAVIAGAEYINDPHGKPGGGKTTLGDLADAVLHLRSRLAAAERERDEAKRLVIGDPRIASIHAEKDEYAQAADYWMNEHTKAETSRDDWRERYGADVAQLRAERDEARAKLASVEAERARLDGICTTLSQLAVADHDARMKRLDDLIAMEAERDKWRLAVDENALAHHAQVATLTAQRDQAMADKDAAEKREADGWLDQAVTIRDGEAEAIAAWLDDSGEYNDRCIASRIRNGAHRKGR